MDILLTFSRTIDAITVRIGKSVYWLVLVAVLISALNAIVRKAFNVSSNAYLEVQWYLFAAIFLLSSGYTFLRNAHVRIDVLSSRLSKRGQTWIDVVGIVFFLLPAAILIMWLSWPFFVNAWVGNESSSNAGGLIRWPVKLLIPVGFGLLVMQACSELIKRCAFLAGRIDEPITKEAGKASEEELAEAIAAEKHVDWMAATQHDANVANAAADAAAKNQSGPR